MATRNRSGQKRTARKRIARKRAVKAGGRKPASAPRRKPASSGTPRKWSAEVAKRSDALDLQPGVFKGRSARSIAQSLKKSAEASHRRKSSPFRSAMSMLNFEINRAGKGLSAERRRVLENAKSELRKAFDRPPA